MRLRARTDANQKAIVKALRDFGCSVIHLHQLDKGVPDIAVGKNGVTLFMQIKDGSRPPSERNLTQDERDFCQEWRGHYAIVESIDDALAQVEAFC